MVFAWARARSRLIFMGPEVDSPSQARPVKMIIWTGQINGGLRIGGICRRLSLRKFPVLKQDLSSRLLDGSNLRPEESN